MRKNIEAVLMAFAEHKSKKDKTCSTDGHSLMSYNLTIACFDNDGYVRVLEAKPWLSHTTKGHIRAVSQFFANASVKIVDCLPD